MNGTAISGHIIYDGDFGHVCTCAEYVTPYDASRSSYSRTVEVDRTVEPTEGGSYWYVCSRCGAGAWSGC